MSSIRQKITVSFPRERQDVWDSLLEHFRETGQANRSAAIISLIDKALNSPTPDTDNVSGLYELDRLSRQVEELREQIAELTRLVSGRIDAPDVDNEPRQVNQKVTRKEQDVGRPEANGEPSSGNVADDGCQAATDGEQAADHRDEPSTEEETAQDEVVRETSGIPQRYARVWSDMKNDWEWTRVKP